MDTRTVYAMALQHEGEGHKIFDWDKAARIIQERKPCSARAGLRLDWENTVGDIYADGKPIFNGDPYLGSNWAVPELEIDGEFIECYIMENQTSFGPKTIWPPSALDILKGGINGD